MRASKTQFALSVSFLTIHANKGWSHSSSEGGGNANELGIACTLRFG